MTTKSFKYWQIQIGEFSTIGEFIESEPLELISQHLRDAESQLITEISPDFQSIEGPYEVTNWNAKSRDPRTIGERRFWYRRVTTKSQ